jgi:eukaryotic-like serine/threonine-protein kinase
MAICPQCGNTQSDSLSFCPNDGSPLVLNQALSITDIFPPGTIISDRYRLVAPIAVGGMGAVYRAEHTLMQRRVAVKLLRPELADRDEARKRFIREAQLCAQLDHPNCVAVYDFGTVGEDVFFLAMEYLEGRTLADALREDGPMSARKATEITCQILDALGAAHSCGIVHRDVKPANIMLINHVDGAERVKLLDFGIAKAPAQTIDEMQDPSHRVATPITLHGLTVGTPEYIAPEQALGRPADARADLYSLAVSLFEILTGKLPFFSNSPVAIVTAHVNDPPPRPSLMAPPNMPISPELDAVILRGMAKRPEERFMDAAEFRQELLEAVPDAIPTEVSVRRRFPSGDTPSANSARGSSGVIRLPVTAPPSPTPLPILASPPKPMSELPNVPTNADPFASWQQLAAVPLPSEEPRSKSNKQGIGSFLGLSLFVLLLGGGAFWGIMQIKGNVQTESTSEKAPPQTPAVLDLQPVEALLAGRNFTRAVQEIQTIVTTNPKEAYAHLLLGHAYMGLADLHQAQKAYFKATDFDAKFCIDPALIVGCIEMLNDKESKLREGARDLFVSCGEPVVPAIAAVVNSDERRRVKQESLMVLEKLRDRGLDLLPTYTKKLSEASSCEVRLLWVKQLRSTKEKRALESIIEQETLPDSKCLKAEIVAAKKDLGGK